MHCILMSQAVTVPNLMMMTFTAEESLAKNTDTQHRQTHKHVTHTGLVNSIFFKVA